MNRLNDDDIEGALYCVNELIGLRRRAGQTVPPWMDQMARRFNRASLMAPSGHDTREIRSTRPISESEFLGSSETADILVLSPRTVRRLGSKLGAEKVGGKLVFRRSAVEDYARKRRECPT